jgi:SAM-dependent methyltransferase
MVKNRHFATREEFDAATEDAGFREIVAREPIIYTLRSDIAARHYFPPDKREAYETILQASQVKARTLRRHGRIRFSEDASTMLCPGEITVLRKSSAAESVHETYKRYPYDFVRKIAVHRELLDKVAARIADGDRVLDLGCGPGLLRERLGTRSGEYLGIDASGEFVASCRERFEGDRQSLFVEHDINDLTIVDPGFDVVCLLNVVYQEGVDVDTALRTAHAALAPNGIVCVSGPVSPASFAQIEDRLRDQLTRDGHLPRYEPEFRALCEANHRLLGPGGNYMTAEEMADRLRREGFAVEVVEQSIYHGTGYFVVGRRR